ncbi:MAG TPA: transketolase [Candidatus Eisenbacteria bacterium]|jgi:transketolase|nr:transketolase [Candidatus Eisenbacteria bacterium]
MPRLDYDVNQLRERALYVRRDIVALLARSQSGHSGGPLSSTDFGTVLFFHEMNIDPAHLDDPKRDLWHFSIGHITPCIYALMGERGYFPLKDLLQFRRFEGHLQGHPSHHDTPGIEVSSGSLGQGLSVCCGMALGSRMDENPRRVYCVMGDGEQQEGQIWEAAMFAAHYKLDNLCAVIDYNRKQIDGDVQDVMGIAPLADKWRAFGWHVAECDGHDVGKILGAFEEARRTKGKPTVILAKTIMGKGVSYMEDDYRWHGVPPNLEQAQKAMVELGTTLEAWTTRLETHATAAVSPSSNGVSA